MSDTPLILSVSGMRGIVGQTLTPATATRFATALAQWVRDQSAASTASPRIIVGRDSRPSGEMLEMAAVAGLLGAGCEVTRLGITSTPGVAVMVDALGADAGLVITASHNPAPWNGLKPLRRGGSAPPAHEAEQIIQRFHENSTAQVAAEAVRPCRQRDDAPRIHAERVARCVDREAIANAGLTVAVNSIHGAGGREALALLDALGVHPFYHFHPEPTGRFPHNPEPTPENLADFCKQAAGYRTDVTFIQDPDADRLAILDEHARFIGEEYTLALCALQRLRQGEAMAANLSTSRMIDDIAEARGARVVRTAVGEANVAAAIRAEGAGLGGEGNGGVILPEVSLVRDSLVGMALVLEMLAQRKQSLSRLVAQVPAYAMVKTKTPADASLTARLGEVLASRYPDQSIDRQDGVRIDWPDRWVHVRPSNTEPIVRFIAEARQRSDADALIADVQHALDLVEPA